MDLQEQDILIEMTDFFVEAHKKALEGANEYEKKIISMKIEKALKIKNKYAEELIKSRL